MATAVTADLRDDRTYALYKRVPFRFHVVQPTSIFHFRWQVYELGSDEILRPIGPKFWREISALRSEADLSKTWCDGVWAACKEFSA